MMTDWANFFVAAGGAAAALTGLLFIAVSLRPAAIRASGLMIGRARSAFYAFTTITFVSLLALAGTQSRLVGVAQVAAALTAFGTSLRFTRSAVRSHQLNYKRAAAYHAGLLVVVVGGGVRTFGGDARDYSALLAAGVLLLLGVALSNSWQLVISHDSDRAE